MKISEKELISEELSKYVAIFDYAEETVLILLAASNSIWITSFATVIGALVAITSASLSLVLSFSTGIGKNKNLKIMRKKK